MQNTSGSYRNLAALAADELSDAGALSAGGPLSFTDSQFRKSHTSVDSAGRTGRVIFVSNRLPIRAKKGEVEAWAFEWDEDALIAQAQDGIGEDMEPLYVGCLPVNIEPEDQEVVALELLNSFNCCPVFLGEELTRKYYQGFCKQQLWPLFHYRLPLMPSSAGRFNSELWQAYVKANKAFADKLVEVINVDEDYVWVHDYHLLVLPSLLRKQFYHVRLGLFLHSPFPSSEIFRTFPKRVELLRSLLNADLIGFHTFDYARHFLSCCSRMLGLEHLTARGAIQLEYYGRNVGIKIMPTGVKPERFLEGFEWQDTIWRRGELVSQFEGQTVLIGVDDMDPFKGIELKLLALEQVLDHHTEWRGKLCLVQVSLAPRSSGKEIAELSTYVQILVQRINEKYSAPGYQPVVWLDRPVPLYERIALYSIADCAVVTCVRDGMNLAPYEYIVCRQGAPDVDEEHKTSMLVLSEFVGCSPSVSGAIRVNPWSIDAVADGIYAAIKMPLRDQHLRHAKHWRYISQHTVKYWAQSFTADLKKFAKEHMRMKCYGLGLGLDTFRMVALMENFRKLEPGSLLSACSRSERRLFLLDYDGTLTPQQQTGVYDAKPDARPTEDILRVLRGLCADARNTVYIISGRGRAELRDWFSSVSGLGLAAEHGFFFHRPGRTDWEIARPDHPLEEARPWKEVVEPVMQVYTESTDGTYIEVKDSALVWHYSDADPDFGAWQAKEMLDHLESVLSNEPVEVVMGNTIVEVKPQGVSKGGAVERILLEMSRHDAAPDFILCVGDDRSDEDMFLAIEHVNFSPHMPAEVFACTVGQKPSKAPFYVNDAAEVASILSRLVDRQPASPTRLSSPVDGILQLPPR